MKVQLLKLYSKDEILEEFETSILPDRNEILMGSERTYIVRYRRFQIEDGVLIAKLWAAERKDNLPW